MCNEASVNDSEIKQLCKQIINGQEAEISQMKTILMRLQSGNGTAPVARNEN
jgi:uncharacterized protein (DUF305 family)